jgi:hypothetical protein
MAAVACEERPTRWATRPGLVRLKSLERGFLVDRGEWSAELVPMDESIDALSGSCAAVVGVQVDLPVFDRAPEALDEDVVAPHTASVHADAAAFGAHWIHGLLSGEPPPASE